MNENEKTKACPFCGEEIKVAAKKCIHCGTWLQKSDNKNNSTKKKIWLCIIAVIFVFILIQIASILLFEHLPEDVQNETMKTYYEEKLKYKEYLPKSEVERYEKQLEEYK